jgi:hypothetical protein
VTDDDTILIPDIEFSNIPQAPKAMKIKRGVAKALIAAKGNPSEIYAIAVKHNLSSQAAGCISRYMLSGIENSRERK